MCSIVGLISKDGIDVAYRLNRMLELTEHRGPDGSGIAIGSFIRKADSLKDLDIADVPGDSGFGHSRLKITGETGIQPLYSCDKRFVLGFNGEIWNYEEIFKSLISDGHDFETDSDGEAIIHLIEGGYKKFDNLLKAVSFTIEKLDGEYAFVVMDRLANKFILVRDPVGVKQLYYGEDRRFFGFCSEKKPLWHLGLNCKRVLPGEIVCISFDDDLTLLKAYNGRLTTRKDIRIFDENLAMKSYKHTIFKAVEKRIKGRKKIGIIYSGGVDSVMIAQIARLFDANIRCYTAGFRDSPDVVNAKKSACELGFDLKVCELTEDLIKEELGNVIKAIESTDHLQVDVAIPIFFAVKMAAEDGLKVLLTGQGADELFAGYPWYPEILRSRGPDFLNNCLLNDVKNLFKDTLEREDKITMFHGVELRVPFLDPDVIDASMSISESLKIRDGSLKYIHRRLAEALGLPKFISWRPKEAAQHGSKVHDVLLDIVREKAVSLENGAGDKNMISVERLGSAHRYTDYHDVYLGNKKVQRVLDSFGERLGLFPLNNRRN